MTMTLTIGNYSQLQRRNTYARGASLQNKKLEISQSSHFGGLRGSFATNLKKSYLCKFEVDIFDL